jgi:Ribbon-helix-helix protein, copG family
MPATAIVTVRLDPELLDAVKSKVRREGTTMSATIVRLLRAEVNPPTRRPFRRTMGMFAGQFEDVGLDELKQSRRALSARLVTPSRRKHR